MDFKQLTKDISGNLGKLRKDAPDVMAGFHALSKGAMNEGALDTKTKELMALAIGVAGHCPGCIGFHTQALVRLGASREEVVEALGVAIYMGGGPSLMYAAEAIEAFEQASS